MVNHLQPSLLESTVFSDMRGDLTVFDDLPDVAFTPRRVFQISNVPLQTTRGGHAHKVAWQMLMAINGTAQILVQNRLKRMEFVLEQGGPALLVPPFNWLEFQLNSQTTSLLVLTSESFDPNDYIYELGGVM